MRAVVIERPGGLDQLRLAEVPDPVPAAGEVLIEVAFATIDGVGSARALARLCEEHVAYQWLCGGVPMNSITRSPTFVRPM